MEVRHAAEGILTGQAGPDAQQSHAPMRAIPVQDTAATAGPAVEQMRARGRDYQPETRSHQALDSVPGMRIDCAMSSVV